MSTQYYWLKESDIEDNKKQLNAGIPAKDFLDSHTSVAQTGHLNWSPTGFSRLFVLDTGEMKRFTHRSTHPELKPKGEVVDLGPFADNEVLVVHTNNGMIRDQPQVRLTPAQREKLEAGCADAKIQAPKTGTYLGYAWEQASGSATAPNRDVTAVHVVKEWTTVPAEQGVLQEVPFAKEHFSLTYNAGGKEVTINTVRHPLDPENKGEFRFIGTLAL